MKVAAWWHISALPLACALLALVWGCGGTGMMPGRGAVALLVVGSLAAAFFSLRAPAAELTWRSPLVWLGAALLWQAVALGCWTAAPEPGLLWWGERAGALLTAFAAASWLGAVRQSWSPEALVRAVSGSGAGVLIVAVIGQLPLVAAWSAGPDLPFGNPNFNVGGALPLLGVALPFVKDRRTAIILACGLAAAVMLGLGLRWDGHQFFFGDATRAVWVGLAAMLGLAAILCLPARWHGWLIGGGEIFVLAALSALIAGVLSLPVALASPSTGYRLSLWQCAVEAIAHAPWCGSGPGSAIVVLQEQAASPRASLWVPSYAEHPHNEYLNALLDGGLVGALLLGAGLLATLLPLWRRRAEPLAAGLLIAWSGVLTHALIESHLSQPGPLLLLAILAGASWAYAWSDGNAVKARSPSWARLIMQLSACWITAFLVMQIWRDFTTGGSPSMIERRAQVRIHALGDQWLAQANEAAAVRARLGDLDVWLTTEAVARARGRNFASAEMLALRQVERQPLDAEAIDLLLRLRTRHLAQGRPAEAQRLTTVLNITRTRAEQLLASVPDNPLSHRIREQLHHVFARLEAFEPQP